MTGRALFAHVGCSKTGTSSLQLGLWNSVEAIGATGTAIPFVGRVPHQRRLLEPLGWAPAKGFAGAWDEAALAVTEERLRSAAAERVLVSNEDLVELEADGVQRLRDLVAAADLDLHVVVTLRDWAQQIPSEYLQFLRHGMSLTFPDFLREVQDRTGHWGENFWRRQDPVDILRRWDPVGVSRLTLIVVPPYAADPDGVFRLMGEAVGVDPTLIQRPKRVINASHGVVEAEVYRRINEALPDTFADYSPAYRELIRLPFSRGVLPTQASDRLRLPDTELDWVVAHATAVVDQIRGSGHRVLGDLDRLVPSQDQTAPYVPVEEALVASAAVETFGRFAEMARERLDAHESQAVESQAAEPPPAEEPVQRPGWQRVFRR